MTRPRIIFAPRTIVGALLKFSAVAALLLLVSPALRTRAAPHVEPLVNPLRRITVGDRVNNMARLVEKEIHRTGEAPQPRDLAGILKRMYPGRDDATLDPWGRKFLLRRRAGTFHVLSTGPDRRQGTSDDIVSDPLPIPD
ncbi:type II secretion system protein GspG [Longimicrobium sp.]|jgi:hypothetical protein|uniref:type II secretion system protein GspG n=1 Tax=Longimicrobium sp. TaxID=2029185 RepID=UPI002F93D4C2